MPEYPYDDWKAAYDGLQRIYNEIDHGPKYGLAHTVLDMVLTLRATPPPEARCSHGYTGSEACPD